MPCPLLRVVLVKRNADELIRTVEALRIGEIGVRRQQGVGQAVHSRRAGTRDESRLAWRILRARVGPEVVIKRSVLLEDHHDVLDRRRRDWFLDACGRGRRGARGGAVEVASDAPQYT